ncbi:MAG: flavin reductase [Clostridiales bacterium]|nr:flavin reductase [Clostridiales bacterium]MDD7035034.1 flavin reductase [Bacillota bacterium]MDY2920359.1 flavin reductase [Lentihominibacter sp.]
MITKVTDCIAYVGANDHEIDLFEGQYVVPNGMAYNSYVIMDDKIAVMDTIDKRKTDEWLENLEGALEGRNPDYLVVQHMEPDHSASIGAFMVKYPEATVVANKKTFRMIGQFFPGLEIKNTLEVENGDALELGSHTLNFVFAPMVHWPEVMMTYESSEKILFSADGFGKFGALDADEDWACEARRYYIGIVGKYGPQVQNVLKKAAGLEIEKICPLHGPVLTENLGYYIKLYDLWSGYVPETEGVCICYTSVYGNTKKAVEILAEKLRGAGVANVVVNDLARSDMAECVEDAFRYDTLVLATTTYNGEIFPFMKQFIDHLTERNFQKRRVAFIENGSWGPIATRVMKKHFEKSKELRFAENEVTILSALNESSLEQIDNLAKELAADYTPVEMSEEKIDSSAMFKIGYGLYVVTCNDGTKNNGLIVNTVTQVSSNPDRIAVNVNKANYSCEVIKNTGVLNVSTLNETAPFKIFEHFGFQTGRNVDKFDKEVFGHWETASNGLPYLSKYANAYISLKVFDVIDMGTHLMFLCDITESQVLNNVDTMSYAYYHNNVKPKPVEDVKGWVCDICGYVYEGDKLPEDYVCPLCKHGASDFTYVE